ncbi:hypothetical protein MNBD_GAMMA21-2858 [hydrothermal vent metagenome]|uniref:Uncharacterized protein n=1 Tax=hydrothermal vent metagenome TaxID=652676 RepID=A0A3B1AC18_9ZZZZ
MLSESYKKMSHDECVELARSIMAILDSWGLNAKQLAGLLALPSGTPTRALRRYRENTPFPNDATLYERVEHIIGISDALRTSYPHNPPMAALWMKQKNKRFDGASPLQKIVTEGLEGLITVRSHVDCSYDWQVNP